MVRKAGRHPSAEDVQDIIRKRQRLASRINDFHITANRLLGASALASVIGDPDIMNHDGYVSDDMRKAEDQGLVPLASDIENTMLAFPSAVTGNTSVLANNLKERECRLRRAKANDLLGHLRETLSGLSYQYINKVRQAKTGVEHLRAYAGIKVLTTEVSFYQQVYNRNSRALGKCDPTLCNKYPLLKRSDCNISTAIADVNAQGQSQAKLPWIWAALDGWEDENADAHHNMLDNDRLLECKSNVSKFRPCTDRAIAVYRVNWLRARANAHRWAEELPRTEMEMIWTTRYFMNQRDVWYDRLVNLRTNGINQSGRNAYCEQMIAQWDEFARLAQFQFRLANPDFPDTWVPIITPV
ncbi:MAG: hypothetical protein QOH50_5173 [Kribbellaceae bacterium]|nr:hypothetical protein [Kribbellaceae bacterium]